MERTSPMMNRQELSLRKLLEFRNAWVAWLIFAVAIAVTVLLWQVSIRLVEDRTEARFRTQSLQLKSAIEERLLNYEQVLAGSAGLFAVTGDVSAISGANMSTRWILTVTTPAFRVLAMFAVSVSARWPITLRLSGRRGYTITL